MSGVTAVLLLAGFLTLGGCGGNDPAAPLETINALLAKDFPLTGKQKADVDRLAARGGDLFEAGQLKEPSAAFDEAIGVLELAESAAMFNKSE